MRDKFKQQSSFAKKLAVKSFHQYDNIRVKCGGKPHDFAFILSHMRSGSSLLSQILNSSSEVASAGEFHIAYSSKQDLYRLSLRTHLYFRKYNLNKKIITDKILHNHLPISDSFLNSQHVKNFVFLIREPNGTLKSLINAQA